MIGNGSYAEKVIRIGFTTMLAVLSRHHHHHSTTTSSRRWFVAATSDIRQQQPQYRRYDHHQMYHCTAFVSLNNDINESTIRSPTWRRLQKQQLHHKRFVAFSKRTTDSQVFSSNSNENDPNDIVPSLSLPISTTTSGTTTVVESNENNTDEMSQYYNKNNIRDQVVSAISGDGGIKVTVCTIRNLLNDLMMQHTLTSIPAQALGRTVCCGLLMSNGIQAEQSVQISIRTEDGPLRGVVTVVTGKGEVRGYVGTPMLGIDWKLEEAVGRVGSVQIVKNHPSWPRPYNGITAVRYGDIDRDVGIYLAESEQRSCAVAAACSIESILCQAAGGYLVEILPDCDDDIKQKVEQNLANLVEKDGGDMLPTGLLLQGQTPIDICSIILDGLDMTPLQQITPSLKCLCTSDRLIRSLRLLPISDVEEILQQEQKVEARCEFCGKVYRMDPNEVRDRMAQATDDPSIATSD
jgi:molecular chaperone Hsp33